ncbi:MAG: hypothetical protein PHV82_08440 [Victivallaceae bacterium]|nr:hypothetical protein [Victivallaceae bacterium]
MSGNVTFQNVNQVILDTLERMHNICICFALLLILLSIFRNYQQFGEYLGLKYLAGVLLAVVLIAVFPAMADSLFKGMLSWGVDAGRRVEEAVKVMFSVEIEGSWYEAVVVGLANLFYRGGIWAGKFVRDAMILVCCGLFLILKTLSPIFIAMLTIPETKSIGVNFLTMALGFIMLPLCMVFGDLTMLWTICQLWEHTGMAAAAASAVGASGATAGALSVLAASPPGAIVVVAGAAGALFSFACVFILLCIVMYVGIPWACISLFRGSGIGNAMAMTLNTASNIMAVSKAGQSVGKSVGKSVSDAISRAADKNKGGNAK